MSATSPDAVRAVLLRAIQIEIRNGILYDTLQKIFEGYDGSVAALFGEMADEERSHGAQLESCFRARFGRLPACTPEPKEVIEAADLEDAEALIFDSMTPEKALEAGLHAEESAREFYRRETARTSDPGLQQVYRELAEFEEDHVRRLQEKLQASRAAAGARSR